MYIQVLQVVYLGVIYIIINLAFTLLLQSCRTLYFNVHDISRNILTNSTSLDYVIHNRQPKFISHVIIFG